MPHIIVDCDPGHDDAVALVLAHRHAEVVGITTVSGNAPLPVTTANALLVTAVIGVDTPIHAGATRPLMGVPQHAPHVHGESGLGTVTRTVHDRKAESDDGVGFLLEAADRDTWIVALGPLTNLALAIRRDPDWVDRIAGISLMGGSTDMGNVTPAAEFNIYADPEAADQVFRSGGKITMCGLNLTRQVMTTNRVIRRLRDKTSTVAMFAAQVFEDLHARIELITGFHGAALHDPCAVLAVTHPKLFGFVSRSVEVELKGTLTRGMTVVDQRRNIRKAPSNVQVAYQIDAKQAIEVVLESLGT